MNAIRKLLPVILLAVAACESAVTPAADVASLALRIEAAPGVVLGSFDGGMVHYRGPSQNDLPINPGETKTITGLIPGVYTVALEGLSGGNVEAFGERSGITVTAGTPQVVTITLNNFVPVIGTVAATVVAGQQLSVPFNPVSGAQSYVVSLSTNPTFSGQVQTFTAAASPASVPIAAEGTYHVRVQAQNSYGSLSIPSASAPIVAGPQIEPLNNHIAFGSDQSGTLQVWVARATGGPAKQLTNGTPAFRPDISPDGRRIIYDLTTGPTLAVMNADGTGSVALPIQGCEADWSPTDSKIIFVTPCTTQQFLGIANSDGSNMQTLTTQQALSPRFSPDGTKIVFYSSRDLNEEIYIIDRDGSNETRLTNAAAPDFYPSFSPDGTKITWVRVLNGVPNMWSMNPDGSDKAQVTNLSGQLIQPDWAPGRNRLVVARDNALYTYKPDGLGLAQIPITGINRTQGGHRWGPCLDASCAPTTGQVEAVTRSSGAGTDPNGYVVTIDGGTNRAIATTDVATFADQSPGSHTLTISGLTPNCTLAGLPTRTVTVTAGKLAQAAPFTIDCIQDAANRIVVTPAIVQFSVAGSSIVIYGTPFDAQGNAVAQFVQLFFSSSNPSVATVDASGRINAQGPGTATITVTDATGRSGTMQVEFQQKFTGFQNYLGHRYAVTIDAVSWVDAALVARARGAHQVVINDVAENAFLTNLFHMPLNQNLWIGLSDRVTEDLFEWADLSPSSPGAATPGRGGIQVWATSEPNGGTGENCVHFASQDGFGKWNDLSCGDALRALVEWDYTGPDIISNVAYLNGHRYALTHSALTFLQARNLAESLGGNLATIDNETENRFLTDIYTNPFGINVWFGLSDYFAEGTFLWLDGTPLGYTNWGTGEPNNTDGIEDCVSSHTVVNGVFTWNDLACAVPLRAIIEWPSLF